jgi:hypothetical protein
MTRVHCGWALLVAVLLSRPVNAAGSYPTGWGASFVASGRTATWQVESLFTAADFGRGAGRSTDLGYEFGATLTYLGPPTRLRWYRIEPMFPEGLTLRARPAPPVPRGACTVDVDFVAARGERVPAGKTFTHGRCSVYPWTRPAAFLAARIGKGLYLISWEDESGVRSEGVPLIAIRWQE